MPLLQIGRSRSFRKHALDAPSARKLIVLPQHFRDVSSRIRPRTTSTSTLQTRTDRKSSFKHHTRKGDWFRSTSGINLLWKSRTSILRAESRRHDSNSVRTCHACGFPSTNSLLPMGVNEYEKPAEILRPNLSYSTSPSSISRTRRDQ